MLTAREAEMAAIDRLLDAARDGRGGAIVLRGEPGIGKSALLDYARSRASGMQVLSATAADAESTFAHATVHQLLGPVLDRVARLPPPQAQALRIALGMVAGDAPDRFLVSLAVLTLLSELAGERPVLCLIDDAHWADGPSAEAIAFVARRLEGEPIAVLAAARPGPGPAGMVELPVTRLDPGAAAALLDLRWGDRIAPAVRDALARATGGNPLPEPLPLAGELERVFLDWVRLREPDLRMLALLCAAEGSSLTAVERAASSLGIEAPLARLGELDGVLRVEASAAVFRHPLVRSAVYQGAGPTARRAAHLALAGALAGEERDADRRAWHRARAAVGADEDVAGELERSAERALRRSGHAAASAALERAADLSPYDEGWARRLVAAADAAWRGGDAVRARALLERAGRHPSPDPAVRLRIAYLEGAIELRSGVPADGLAILMAAADDAARIAPELVVGILSMAGEAAFQAADDTAMDRIVDVVARLPETGDERHVLLARLYLAANARLIGGPAGAGLVEGLAGIEELDDPDLLARAAGMAFGLGEYAFARRLRTRAVARARALGAAGTLAWALRVTVLDELARSRYAWAEAVAAEGLQVAQETGQPNLACQFQAIQAELAALRGREPEARRLADDVLADAGRRRLHGAAAIVRRGLARMAVARGLPGEALTHLDELWRLGPTVQRGIAQPCIPDLVEASVRAGRPEVGAARMPALLAWAEAEDTAEARALVARARALLAASRDAAAADALFQDALREHAGDERPLERARTSLLYGEHLRRSRRRADARAPLRSALEAFETLGTPAWAERARNELRASGETARRRDASTIDQLTRQELQVVRAVSQGVTNREAAAQLFISPRTVDHHLRSVFRKLGVRSRAEMIRVVLAGALD